MADNYRQISGAAGLLFVILFVVGLVIQGDVPVYTDGGEDIAAWFADNGDQYLVGEFIIGLGFIFFYFPFLIGLYTALRSAESDPPLMSRVALAGGIGFPVAGLAAGISQTGLALLEGDVSADVASMAAAASFHGFAATGAFTAIIMGAAALVIVRTGVFWAWLGWLGGLLAIAGIVGAATAIENDPEGVLSIIGFIAFIGFGVWILGTSAALLQSRTPLMRQTTAT